ncbi:cyclase, partial [Micromonospora sp. NPDC049799]
MDDDDRVLLRELDGPQPAIRLPRALGWLSLAIGVGALAVPDRCARLVGVDDVPAARTVVPALGARYLA